jgi:signal transduction histidine kinase
MLGASARMNAMIDAMLALAQLSNQPLAREAVDLSKLARLVIEDLQRSQPARQVRVTIAPGLHTHGDPVLLRQLMENLLGNAWKYTAKVAQAHISLNERVAEGGQGLRVYEIADNGAGFDMRSADRLFGLFQRLHASSEFPGTGLGLASVLRIVRRHGGQIRAEAEPGRGARFIFSLPG